MFLAGINENKELQGFYPWDMVDLYSNLPTVSINIDEKLHKHLLEKLYKFVGEKPYKSIYTLEDIEMFEEVEVEQMEPIEIPTSYLEIEVENLNKENETLKLALAALDTQRQQDKLDTQLAIAELTSTLMGGE